MVVAHVQLQQKGQCDRNKQGMDGFLLVLWFCFSDLSEHFVLLLLEGDEEPSGFKRLAKRLEELD